MNTVGNTMKYVIYIRKSTDTEDKQVLSLESQENELLRLAETQNLEVVKVFKESKSAKEPGRPVFNEMMDFISRGNADAILCWKIDRLTRNPVDGGQIQWLLQKSKIKCITTFEKNYFPNDNVLIMSIEQAMANQYIRDLSVNVKRGIRTKLERGEWPSHAPLGYLNDKATKKIVLDKKLSPYIVRAFDLFLDGKSHGDISNILYAEGLRSSSGKKVFKSLIHRIIINPFYMGVMVHEEKYYPGIHIPLISKNTFEQAQEIIGNKSRPKNKQLLFPLRGFMTCNSCGCSLTATLKKGHQYYYCTNGKGECLQHKKYMRENYIYDHVARLLESVRFSERKIELMYKAAVERSASDTGYSDNAITELTAQSKALKTRESRLLDAFLAEQITKELYDTKVLELQNEAVLVSKQIKQFEMSRPSFTLEPIKKLFLQANKAQKEFLDGDDNKKHEVVKNLLWNLSYKDQKIVTVKYKSPFEAMAKASKNGSISELLWNLDSNQDKRYQKPLSYH